MNRVTQFLTDWPGEPGSHELPKPSRHNPEPSGSSFSVVRVVGTGYNKITAALRSAAEPMRAPDVSAPARRTP